jgi:hypothetical protein
MATMECPKCGYEQPRSDECMACGIIIDKYRARPQQAPEPFQPTPLSEHDHQLNFPVKSYIIAILFVIFICYSAYSWWNSRAVSHGPGQVAPDPPAQSETQAAPFTFDEYRITPLADFYVNARVLSTERYFWGEEAKLVPVDLALGWGPMSDERVLEKINIRQSNRFYFWSTEKFPIPRKKIETSSANMHLIPSDSDILKKIKNTRKGNVVDFKGYLVKVTRRDGWRWKSSLSRNDTGNGACELIFVEEYEIR